MKFLIFFLIFSNLNFDYKFYSFKINYGSEDCELGIIIEPETPPIGPNAFSVDSEGNIYIADPVNSSIKILSVKEGKISRVIPFKGLYDDLMVSPEGDIYILKRDSSEILKIEKSGKVYSIKLEPGVSKMPTKLFLWKGGIFVKKEGEIVSLTQMDKAKSEIPYLYLVEYLEIGRGRVKKIDGKGKEISELILERENLLSIEFLNEDREGNFYIQIEYLIGDSGVGLEVLKIKPSGEKISIPIPENDYFIWTSRLLFVDDRGWIYQVLPEKDCVKVNVWRN